MGKKSKKLPVVRPDGGTYFGIIGVTMAKTFKSCERKWWFEHPARLPAGKGSAWEGQLFGTVLHGVVERWLKGDRQGRDAHGRPVDLYPPGWQWCPEKRARVSPEQERMIKRMVRKAIETGVLERIPGRKIEAKWYALLAPEESAWGHVPPLLAGGTTDYMAPGVIQDHKGVKDRKYMKSAKEGTDSYLGDDLQVRVYARAMQNQFGIDHKKDVTLQHNYFNRTTGEVKKRTVVVTGSKIQEGVEEFVKLAKRMHKVARIPRGDGSVKKKGNYKFVRAALDGFGDGPEACNAYGGCPYFGICRGKVAMDTYAQKKLRELLPPEAGKDFDMAKKSGKAKKSAFEADDDEDKKTKKGKKKAKEEPDEDEDEEDEDEKPKKKGKKSEKVDLAAKVKLPILEILGLKAKSFTSLTAANLAERLLCVSMQLDGITQDDLKAAAAAKKG